MPSCRNAELSVPRHSVKVRLHHYEKQENAFERTAKDVYALASYHGSAPGRDEHMDLCDRQAGGAHHGDGLVDRPDTRSDRVQADPKADIRAWFTHLFGYLYDGFKFI